MAYFPWFYFYYGEKRERGKERDRFAPLQNLTRLFISSARTAPCRFTARITRPPEVTFAHARAIYFPRTREREAPPSTAVPSIRLCSAPRHAESTKRAFNTALFTASWFLRARGKPPTTASRPQRPLWCWSRGSANLPSTPFRGRGKATHDFVCLSDMPFRQPDVASLSV